MKKVIAIFWMILIWICIAIYLMFCLMVNYHNKQADVFERLTLDIRTMSWAIDKANNWITGIQETLDEWLIITIIEE
jgi:hypothetical protein